MTQPQYTLSLRTQSLGLDEHRRTVWQTHTETRRVPTDRTAIIICDMWDDHWSRGAVERVNEMVSYMDTVVGTAREQGTHILHAPSETMDHYAAHPARLRMRELAPVEPPPDAEHAEPPLPVDVSGGSSDTGETDTSAAWRCQHPAIHIDPARDGISDNGREIYSYLQHHHVEQVLIMGVHTNMCVLNRSFAIKQMVRWGVPIALVRDLTDTMYSPAMPPYVSHEEGTELVVGYIEKFWCPSVHSTELVSVDGAPNASTD